MTSLDDDDFAHEPKLGQTSGLTGLSRERESGNLLKRLDLNNSPPAPQLPGETGPARAPDGVTQRQDSCAAAIEPLRIHGYMHGP